MSVLVSQVVCSQEWTTDLNLALNQASAQNKNVLLYFSVPEACEKCLQLEKNIWRSEEFQEYVKPRLILATTNFSDSASIEIKTENLLIVEKYNKDGFFPFVVIVDKDGKILGKSGVYNNETPAEYLNFLSSIVDKGRR